MNEVEFKLLKLLKERSYRTGRFRLASGTESDYYVDCRLTTVSSVGAHLVGEVLYDRTKELPFDAIGGPATGAIPLVTSAVIAWDRRGQRKEGFWVRPDTKAHGTVSLIEGKLSRGDRVILVDDVVTTGKTVRLAIRAVRAAGAEVLACLALVDRLEGAEVMIRESGVVLYSAVFTIHDLASDFRNDPRFDPWLF